MKISLRDRRSDRHRRDNKSENTSYNYRRRDNSKSDIQMTVIAGTGIRKKDMIESETKIKTEITITTAVSSGQGDEAKTG